MTTQPDDIDAILAELYHGSAEYTDLPKSPALTKAKAKIEKLIVEARIDELEKLHRYDGKDYDTEVDEIIDERIDQLMQPNVNDES